MPEPRGRGTVGVILSSVATTLLCLWISVHPNILANSNPVAQTKYNLSWMALSLLFPEIMMLCSFGQWRKARRLQAMWVERFPVTKECPDSLGMEGAFFVLAGGFLVKEGEGYKTVLTPLGFEHYVRSGQIDAKSFDRRQITDKGKASSMAKALVLCQATWFLYQCIRRGSEGLPITILEVHIITQVLFMFVLYFFWWQKPLSV
ncbi:hypothetical protein P167DRAFT_491404, partial [Morchella conica CCBAS932]